jgi:hypothetical protein
MNILRIVVAVLLLLLGRQLFWLFVGGTGFVLAMEVVARLTPAWPDWLTLLVALLAGIIGALLAVVLQQVAVGIAGFIAGGYVVISFLNLIGVQEPLLSWILAAVGAVAGLVLAVMLFDWALILLSSAAGATLLVQSLVLAPPLNFIIFAAALILGILIQTAMMLGGGEGRRTVYRRRRVIHEHEEPV